MAIQRQKRIGQLVNKSKKQQSLAAREVAKEVLETIGQGKIPVVSKIALKKGYSKATAKNPQQIKKAKSYREVLEPVIESLENERIEILKRMKKTRNKAKYRDLTYSLDIVTKNHQLLSGGNTENVGIAGISNSLNELINQVKNES